MRAASLFIVMPALAVAILSMAPATAENKLLASTTGNCSVTTWPAISAVQCTKPYAHSYVECTDMVRKSGATHTDAWWWCSNQGFKN